MKKEKEKAPAIRWYAKDILGSARVAEMSLAEEGAYRRALDYCWINGTLPADSKRLAAVIGKKCTVKMADKVKSMFTSLPSDPSRIYHERHEKERIRQEEYALMKHVAGIKGAEIRWSKQNSTTIGLPLTEQSQPHDKQNSTTIGLPLANDMAKDSFSFSLSNNKSITPSEGVTKTIKKKTKKEGFPHYQQLVAVWFTFYSEHHDGAKPSFLDQMPRMLKLIGEKLRQRTGEWTEFAAGSAAQDFFTRAWNMKDSRNRYWLREHFLLTNLNTQFDMIMNKKGQKHELTTTKDYSARL